MQHDRFRHFGNRFVALPEALNGVALTTAAFDLALGGIGGKLVTICLLFFAFTTALGWCVYGERCAIYLFGDKALCRSV